MFPFSDSKSDTYPVLTVYLRKGPSLSAQLTDVLKPVKELIPDLGHDAAMSLRADIDRLGALRDRLDGESAPAVGIFACDGEGWFHLERLAVATDDQAVVGPYPYLRPWRAAYERPRTLVAVVDKRHSWIYAIDQGASELIGELSAEENVKKNYGGWQGYAERNVRGHADELARRHFQNTAAALGDVHKAAAAVHLAVGGHRSDVDEFVAVLHPYLQHLHIGTFVVDPRTATASTVAAAVEPLVDAERKRAEFATVDHLLDLAHQGNRAVLGLADSIAAVNVRAVRELVVSGPYAKSGAVCDACGWLARNGASCPACGAETRETADIVAELIEATIRDGGNAVQLTVASQLDAHGLGAELRFPLPASLT